MAAGSGSKSFLGLWPWRLVAVLSAMTALLACSSSGKGGARAGNTASASSSGAGGEGGTSGEGGAAGRDSDAAVGGGLDAKTKEVAGAMTAEEACVALVRARCQRGAACGGAPDDWGDCAAISIACPEYFFNAGSTRTVAGITACLDEQRRQPCTDLNLELLPSCWSPGTRPAGASCAYGSSCASRKCSAALNACGTCSPGPAATGESCAKLPCGMGDFCHPGSKLCTSGSTIVHAAKGEACDLSASPAVGCTGDSECIHPDGQTSGTCQPMPMIEKGQPCYQVPGRCRPPLICFTSMDGTDTTSECREPAPEHPLCGAAPCDDTTYCTTIDKKRVCLPRAALGEGCGVDGSTATIPCMPGSFCIGVPGICTRVGARGEACSLNQLCDAYLVCSSGHCAPLGAEACP